MATFEFDIEERSVAPGEHSWVAIENSSGLELPLPAGGSTSSGKDFVGQYPEIQEYLKDEHGLDVPLVYVSQLDSLTIHPDGTTTWVFRRQEAEVIVNDIPRTVIRITTGG